MKPAWGGNRGRGRGPRGRGRGWRGNSSGPRPGAPPPLLPMPMEYLGGPPMMRGHRGGYRGNHRGPPDNFNQHYPPHSNEPPWARLRARPMLPDYASGLQQRRRFLSPPRSRQSPVRPSSPLPGSEEYMQREISEKSALLKRQLELEGPPPLTNFNPDKFVIDGPCDFASDSTTENFCDNPFSQLTNVNLLVQPNNNVQNKISSENVESPRRSKRQTPRRQKQEQVLSVEEIHDKIINHISNLSHGKKVNLVNQAGPSGYDIAVQQITRQKRVELSKALRDMCNNKFKETQDTSDVIKAIIPDFDIKIEELPREVVEQLSSTLDEDVEEHIQTMCIDPEVMFQQAADMLNTMLDVDSEVKDDVNLANCSTPLQDEFNDYANFQNVDESGEIGLDSNVSQNIGDPSTDFVPNDVQMQPGCTDLPFDETMASTTLNFHSDPIPCQSPADFSIPPPMNFSVPPPVNFGIPPPPLGCDQLNNESLPFASFSDSQHDNLNIPDDTYNIPSTQLEEGCELYPEGNADDAQYYSPAHPGSDDNSLQATPVFNDLMMGQDLLNDNNIEQTDLSLPLNVDEEGGILLPTNPCDNPPFNLMEDQESEQYFDLNTEVDDGILMPPNEQPYNLIAGQDQLPENLTEQTEQYFQPNVDEVDNILLPSETLLCKNVMKEGKAIILSDIRIPPMLPIKVTNQNVGESDVLTEAAELEACLAQGEVDLNFLDTSKSKKISFTFTKTNNFIKSKILADENDDISETSNSQKKTSVKGKKQVATTESSMGKTKLESEIKEEPVKVEIKPEVTTDEPTIKAENEEKLQEIEEKLQGIEEKPQIEKKVTLTKLIQSVDPKSDQDKMTDKTKVTQQEAPIFKKSKTKNAIEQQQIDEKNIDEKVSNAASTKEEPKSKKKETAPTEKQMNTLESVKETKNLPEMLVRENSPSLNVEGDKTEKFKKKVSEKQPKPEMLVRENSPGLNVEEDKIEKFKKKISEKQPKRSKNLKSKSKSAEREAPPREKSNSKKSSRKFSKTKQKSFEEEEFVEKKKEKKSKSKASEMEEYPKSESYKSKFERSRYDLFYSQKYEDGYKKKYKEKGVVDEDRHRRSDSDRSFEKQREKFRSSDSEHSETHRFSKYHTDREDLRHSKRYFQDSYPYRTDYVDYKNDYYNSQKYGYAPDYYSRQESPYSPEEFEAKSSHHTQKHKTRHEKAHKKRSKKHKRQREKSNTSLSSISSSEQESPASSLNRKTKHKPRHSDPVDSPDERSTSKGHKIPLKERIQMLYESKFDRKRDSSCSDYDENRKIKSEPVSPEVSRKPSPERSRSVEKLTSRRETMHQVNANSLREAEKLTSRRETVHQVNANNLREAEKLTSRRETMHQVNANDLREAEKLTSRREVVHQVNANDLREALNKKALTKSSSIPDDVNITKTLLTKTNHPGTPVVPFTNKPCPALKQVEDPLREREEMIMRDKMISFRNKPCPLSKKPVVETQLELEQEEELQLAKELPDIDNIAKIISNLSTIVAPTKDPQKHEVAINIETQKVSRPLVKLVEDNEKPERTIENTKLPQQLESKKFDQRPWKSPGEKKFMMEHLQRNPLFEEEEARPENSIRVNFSEFVVIDETSQEEKLAFVNPEPTMEEPSKNFSVTNVLNGKDPLRVANIKSVSSESSVSKIAKKEEKETAAQLQNQSKIQKDAHSQDFLQSQNVSIPNKPKPEKAALKFQETKHTKLSKEVDSRQSKPKPSSKIRELEEINSTSEKAIKSVTKIEKLKEVETKPLESIQSPSKSSQLPNKSKLTTTETKPLESVSAESTCESTKVQKSELKPQTKSENSTDKTKNTRTRSKSRSRSKTKEIELLHSAEVSSTSDTAAKTSSKHSVHSRSKSKIRNSTPQPLKEESSNSKSETDNKSAEQLIVKTSEPAPVKPEETSASKEKMLITTYTQTQTDDSTDNKKDAHKNRKSSKRDKVHSGSSHKSGKSKANVSTQTYVTNTNSYTQTPSARCKSVQVQIEVEQEKPPPKKNTFVQTDPVIFSENYDDEMDNFDDKLKNADKSSRKILKAVRRRKAVERMFDLDKEIERLTKLRQNLYRKLNFDSESDEDESSIQETKVARLKISNKRSGLKDARTSEFVKNSNRLDSKKRKPVAVKEKPRVNKKQKKKSDANVEKQSDLSIEEQNRLVVNVANLRTYKKPPNTTLTRDIESPTKSVIKNQDSVIPEGTCKSNSAEKVTTTNIDNTKSEVIIEKPKITKNESKVIPEKPSDEQKPDVNKNVSDTNTIKGKAKTNEQKNEADENLPDANLKVSPLPAPVVEIIKIGTPDKILPSAGIEELTPKINTTEKLEKNEESEKKDKNLNENANPEQLNLDKNSNQSNNADKEQPQNNPSKADVETINNKNLEQTPAESQSNANPEPLPLHTNEPMLTSKQMDPDKNHPVVEPTKTPSILKEEPTTISSEEEKPSQPEAAKNNESSSNTSSSNQGEETVQEIKIEPKTPTREDQQPEISDCANSETEDSVRSTRSRQRKSKDAQQTPTPATPEGTTQTKTESKRKQRKKTESENKSEETSSNAQQTQQIPTSEDIGQSKSETRRRQRRKTESENKQEASVERDANASVDEVDQSKSKRRSNESKSPKCSKDIKPIIKFKLKTSDEHKRKFEEHLKESTDVKAQLKRRKKTATASSAEDVIDEISKTIDEVARNVTGNHSETMESAGSSKLRRRERAKEDADHKNKLRRSKSVPRLSRTSRQFDGEMKDRSLDVKKGREKSDVPENQDLTSDSLAFRGFKNISESDQEVGKINSTAELSLAGLEATVGTFSENFADGKQSQKRKRKKTDAIELDPEIDSQNLLQIQMIKRPKSAFEPYTDSSAGATKKKKRYPFSGGKLNYRTKKRKSSSDSKSSSSVKRKSSVDSIDVKSYNHNITESIVRVTRYSLSQLEEIRKQIREKKEDTPASSNSQSTHEEIPLSEDQQVKNPEDTFIENKEPVEKLPSDAYNLKIVSVESLGPDASHENIPPQLLPLLTPTAENCDVIEEEIHLKEEIRSVHSVDSAPEAESCNSINSALHLETSNEAFEDFVKESMHEYKDNDDAEPPILSPEVEELDDMKTSDCEYLEVLDEDDDFRMDFQGFSGAILVVKVIASTAVAASDKGKVFSFSMLSGNLINTFDMSKLAITSMIVIKRGDINLVYTGSLDSTIGVLNFNTKEVIKHEKIPEPVQCMEYAWNYIFVGSDRGSLIRYDLNSEKVEESIKISDFNVLVIKATQEGPRKVLVVATRNAPVCIRDASSGLLLRTMQTPFSPTVYTLLFEKNLIYCGTSQHDILVYTFEDGQLIFKHEATKSKGVVCMQIVGNLLFAGCYNGNIYVYNTKTNIHLGTMTGPGGLMLSMEIIRNKIIVGTKSSNFRAWRIPQKYLDQM